MSSESSRSWTTSPKRAWSSISFSSRSRFLPARSSISGRHSSTSRLAAAGGACPVSRSRTSIASAVLDRRVGAVGDLVELAAMEAVVEHGGQILGDAGHAARADRLDARLLDRVEHRARLLAAGHELAVHVGIVTGELERDRVGMAAHDRGFLARELARRLRQPRLAADHAGTLGGVGDLQLGLARDRAQAAGHRALERLGRRFPDAGLRFDVRGHLQSLAQPDARGRREISEAPNSGSRASCRTRRLEAEGVNIDILYAAPAGSFRRPHDFDPKLPLNSSTQNNAMNIQPDGVGRKATDNGAPCGAYRERLNPIAERRIVRHKPLRSPSRA